MEKDFRSYLDQGLFWGEHIQFIHLLLLPVYLLWPSHLLLEFCETAALAIGAIPLYRMGSASQPINDCRQSNGGCLLMLLSIAVS